jgi:hypothetical protein
MLSTPRGMEIGTTRRHACRAFRCRRAWSNFAVLVAFPLRPCSLTSTRPTRREGDKGSGIGDPPEDSAAWRSDVRAAEAPQGARGSAHLLATSRGHRRLGA